MQKLINLLAVTSFLGTAGIVGGGTYVYVNKDVIIENIKSQVTADVTEAITGALPGMLDSTIPELPSTTGGVLPSTSSVPTSTGGVLPF